MADSVRRQLGDDLAAAFEALTIVNGAKVDVALVQRYMQQPEEHPNDLGYGYWRIGFLLGKETRRSTDPGLIDWELEGEAQIATSASMDQWDSTEIAAGAIEEWRAQAGADALDELKHALEGTALAVSRNNLAISTTVTERYVDEGFSAREASSQGGRHVYAGAFCRFRIFYQDNMART